MNRRNSIGTALVVLAVVLFTVPALFPVQPMLEHNTRASTNAPAEEFEQDGQRVVAYENLSERGQELYRLTLENNGEYRVSQDQGAPDFEYPTREERAQARENGDRARPENVIVKRPEDDADLPDADEHFFGPREEEAENGDVNETERRQQAMRYDLMRTTTEYPPLGATPQLIRLFAVLLAVVSLGLGGYLLSSK